MADLYNIINPSDRYTIECADFEIAVVACLILGEGRYAFTSLANVKEVPFLFGGVADADAFCQEHFQDNLDTVMTRVRTQRAAALADAFDSVLIGNRQAFNAIAPDRSSPSFGAARLRWHDVHRSSLNDIGGRAYVLAKAFRKMAV